MPQWRRPGLLIFLAASLIACSQTHEPPKPTEALPAAVKLTAIMPQIYLAGYYGATTQGYFAHENLTSELVFTNSALDQGDADVLAQVASGEAQFGIASADSLLLARQQGLPLVAVASIYQDDPTAVISLKTKNITQPSDLEGKKVLVWTFERVFRLFATSVGLDMATITLISPPDNSIAQGLTMFVTGQVDAMVVNWTDTAVSIAGAGIQFDVLAFNTYGVATYPNLLFTTEAMIQTQPAMVQGFVSAFIRGMQYAIANPTELTTWFIDNYSQLMPPEMRATNPDAMQSIVPLIQPPNTQPGVMTADIWQFIYDAMLQANLLQPLDVEQAYTRQFVNNYYQHD